VARSIAARDVPGGTAPARVAAALAEARRRLAPAPPARRDHFVSGKEAEYAARRQRKEPS